MTLNDGITTWAPPAGYKKTTSLVEGISVYAPEKEEIPVVPQVYKCPQCGAVTQFNVAAGSVACEHCGYIATSSGVTVGKNAEDFEFTFEALEKHATGWGTQRREMCCEQCGALQSLDTKTLSSTCSFCGSNKIHLYEMTDQSIRPSALIPFKIEPKSNRNRALEWLGKGWFHPKELRDKSLLDLFTGIYLPFWTFDAGIEADWRAEVGYERTERYYDSSDKEWKTRTTIDWRWETGNVNLAIDDMTITGNSHIKKTILDDIMPFHYEELVEYQGDYLAGWNAQNYDIELADAWKQAKDVMREKARDACRQDIPSVHVRNLSLTADFSDESWRYVLLPVYLASYRYGDKVFQVMVNGQTGVIAGQKPVEWWKVGLAIAAILSPGAMLGLIGLLLLIVGGIGAIPLAIGVILLVIGMIISFRIFQQAVKSES